MNVYFHLYVEKNLAIAMDGVFFLSHLKKKIYIYLLFLGEGERGGHCTGSNLQCRKTFLYQFISSLHSFFFLQDLQKFWWTAQNVTEEKVFDKNLSSKDISRGYWWGKQESITEIQAIICHRKWVKYCSIFFIDIIPILRQE